ncbi:hypothetical protein ACOCEA_08725 [Maribacter sp. CXY002]|uniref:hypothetical protein n=1 Tax=Maribacter luteocoastalis TaxID=3407671 RepID=UPI003B684626
MLLRKTNLKEKLDRERLKQIGAPEIAIKKVYEIFANVSKNYERIEHNFSNQKDNPPNNFNIDLLDASSIYHIDQIKKICIDYRLRFLNTNYFKGKIPYEAISKISTLEREHAIEIKGFKIIAPSKLFKLEDKDDPLLFAPLGNGYFYLIHKWGSDLHPLRKFLMWPFKNVINLISVVLVMSLLVTLLVPEGLFSKNNSAVEFWIICFFMFKCIASIVIFYGFAHGKNFNHAIWNNKYLKA